MGKTRRLAIRVSYDGGAFSGWQRQRSDDDPADPTPPSVQSVLEAGLSELLNEPIQVFVAGRTDTGVHALGQCAHFDTRSTIPVEAIVPALASGLPRDLAVWKAARVPGNFNARRDAVRRSYRYLMAIADKRAPPSCLARRHVGHMRGRHDIERMVAGAKLFVGKHDFRFFRSSQCQAKSPVRTIDKLTLRPLSREASEALGLLPEQVGLEMRVTAQAFLMRQVRCLAGGLAMLGRGKLTEEDIRFLLAGKMRDAAKTGIVPAPGEGLVLAEVDYGPDSPI